MFLPGMLAIGTIDPAVFALLVSAILGAGGIGGFVAYRKVGAEKESIATTTLTAVIAELRAEIVRRDSEIGQRDEQIRLLRERVAVLESVLAPGGRPLP